ncbi:MAG: S41 family peptidase [bacterium]
MKRYITHYIVGICIIFLYGCQENDIVTEYNSDPLTNFDAVWSILDTKYCYFIEKNIDWDEIYWQYAYQAESSKTVLELFDTMEEMIDNLQDGHVNIYSYFDISSCSGWYEDYPTDYYTSQVYGERYLGDDYRISGGFNYNLIAGDSVGYIRYSSFSSGFSTAGLYYIDAIFGANCKGIIIDVRSNGGGSLDYSKILASSFFKERTVTGYMRYKTGDGHDDFSDYSEVVTDPADALIDWSDKKVVVLSNRGCYSATNDFIMRMKQAPNVTVVGGITGGGGGLPLSQELPNGWMIRFSAVPMYDYNKETTEFGVEPDIEVHITDETSDIDPIIEKAVEIIKESAEL